MELRRGKRNLKGNKKRGRVFWVVQRIADFKAEKRRKGERGEGGRESFPLMT